VEPHNLKALQRWQAMGVWSRRRRVSTMQVYLSLDMET
jgi:hypothetical protein